MSKSKNKYNSRKISFHYDLELDLHGYNIHESLQLIEEMIYLHESSSILLIHGNGDGILREKIREFVKESSFVSMVRPGESNNIPGGDGVTVIYTS